MDKIYYNGKIHSMDKDNNRYTAIGISGNKISFLGTNLESQKIETATRIDLKGKTVLPGFIDSHLHMLNYAFLANSYKMYDASSIKNIIEEGRNHAYAMEGESANQWLYGRGWNQDNFSDEKRFLTKADLDKISTDRPILFIRMCGHVAAVNSKALEMVMKLNETKDYMTQIDTKKGILTEASVKLCYNIMNPPTVEQIKQMILSVQGDYNKAGITAVESDNFLSLPGRNWQNIMTAYKELETEKKLTLRVREQASFTAFDDMKEFIDSGNRTNQGGAFYKVGPIKLYQDGSLGAKTALLNEPYGGSKANCGIMVHSEEELGKMVEYSYKNDMQILTHTIGDKASDMVCTAYEKAIQKYGDKNLRLAINHLQFISSDLIERMAKSNILAYIQPVFVAGDKNFVGKYIGPKREKLSYIWKSMEDGGLVCCGGSDSPVENFDILENIQIAVTRDGLNEKSNGWMPDQKLSIEESIRLFTTNNAYGAFEEKSRGTIETGKLADIVILDKDPFEVEPHQVNSIKIELTMVDGEVVYHRA